MRIRRAVDDQLLYFVDPAERRAEIAEAAWRVIRRDGIDAATWRNVSREAGLAIGSVRRYFDAPGKLLVFTMRLVVERQRARIRALEVNGDARQTAERVLGALLPLDVERRIEAEVWLAFTGKALADPGFRVVRSEGEDLVAETCRRLVRGLIEAGWAEAGQDEEVEAELLMALIDGLVRRIVTRPEQVSSELAGAVVARHLDGLGGRGR